MTFTKRRRTLSALLLVAASAAGIGIWALRSTFESPENGTGQVSGFAGSYDASRVAIRPLAPSSAALAFALARGDTLGSETTPVTSLGTFEFETSAESLAFSFLSPNSAAGTSTRGPRSTTAGELEPEVDGFRVHVRPLAADGAAISEGRLEAYSQRGHLLADVRFARDGAKAQLPRGVAWVRLSSPGHAPVVRKLLVLADDTRDWILPRARPLDVTVATDKMPEAPIQVALIGALGQLVDVVPLGPENVARFPHVPPGPHRVWAGSFDRETSGDISGDAPGEGKLALSLDLSRGTPETRAVVLPKRKGEEPPCDPHVTSSFRGPEGRVGQREVEAAVQADGRLSLILPPVETEIVVSCGESRTQARFFGERPAGLSGFLKMRTLTGRVNAPESTSLSSTEIGFVLEGFRSPLEEGIVQDDGTYELRVPENARGHVFVRHPLLGKRSVKLETGKELSNVDFDLLPEHYVEGHLEDQHGQPVSHATVAYTSMTGGSSSAQTNEDGFFRVGPVGADQGYLVAFADGRRLSERPLSVTPGQGARAVDWQLGQGFESPEVQRSALPPRP